MAAFVSALKAEYGDHVAQMASSRLQGPMAEGKPLTAFMVRQVAAEAGSAAAGVFLSGVDFNGNPVANSLDAAVDAYLGETWHVDTGALSPKQKDLRDIMKRNIAEDLLSGRGSFGSVQEMFAGVQAGKLGGAGNIASMLVAGPESQLFNQPGAIEDKARLSQLLAPDGAERRGVSLAVWRLGEMRAEQPTGPLTPATIWKACFNEAIPPGASAGPGALARALDEKVQSMQENYIAGLPPHSSQRAQLPYKASVADSMHYLPLATLEAARRGDAIDGHIALNCETFHRQTPAPVLFRKALVESRGLLNTFGGAPLEFSFTGRDGAGGALSMTTANMLLGADTKLQGAMDGTEADPLALASRDFANSFSAALSAFVGEDAKLPDAQAKTLFSAMGQNGNFVLRKLETAIGVPFDPENTSASIGLSHGENGDIIVRHSISDVASAPDGGRTQTERSQLVMVIHADGTMEGNPPVHVSAPRQV
jgi:hypothetical protein